MTINQDKFCGALAVEKNFHDYLPNELLYLVIRASLQGRKDFLTLSLVCRLWNEFVANIDPQEIYLKPSMPVPRGLKALEAGKRGYYTYCPSTPKLDLSKDPSKEPRQYLGLPTYFHCKPDNEEFIKYIRILKVQYHPDNYWKNNKYQLEATEICQKIQKAHNILTT